MVSTIAEAVELVRAICLLPGNDRFLRETDQEATAVGLRRAIKSRDTPALYDWLMTGFSFQGISDRIASDYIDRHGNSTWHAIESALAEHRCQCPKLGGFDTYRNCGYRKSAATCQNPVDLADCPVPELPLRKGDLNQLAFSLYYFLRHRCQGDLVGTIDGMFATIDEANLVDPIKAKRDRLIAEFSSIHAVSAKLIAMMLGSLLMAGGPTRRDWVKVGRSLVTIDSLVHNFLHRTGILTALDQGHRYGPACHGSRGCAAVVYQLADRIDAREANPAFPRTFPRFVEVAIWSFCAETRADTCNGRHIDDRFACTRTDCPVGDRCSRLPLRPVTPAAVDLK